MDTNRTARLFTFLALSVAIALTACSENSSPTSETENLSYADFVEEEFNDLPKCTSKRDSSYAFVKANASMYICKDRKWVLTGEVDDDTSDSTHGPNSSSSSSSSTKSSKDNNSEHSDGTDGDDDGEDEVHHEDDPNDNTLETTRYIDKLTGLAQKGSFAKGSAVNIYEITDTRTLETGKVFHGEVVFHPNRYGLDTTGFYEVRNVSTSHRFAIVEVKGLFKSEFSNMISPDTFTIRAISDISNRNNVNVNLFTHLEYERIVHLIGKGMSLTKAKEKAYSEILDLFNLTPDGKKYSEDLDIQKSTPFDGALCAASILSLSAGTIDNYSKIFKALVNDFKINGKLDDNELMTKAADNTLKFMISVQSDTKGFYDTNVEQNLSNPGCLKATQTFIEKIYDLDECTENDGNKNPEPITNEFSALIKDKVYLYCTNSGTWDYASDFLKDTYNWKAGEIGEFKEGNITNTIYVYNENGTWTAATAKQIDQGECSRAIEYDKNKNVTQYEGKWYFCVNFSWEWADDYVINKVDTWPAGEDGDVKDGTVGNFRYIYDETREQWVFGNWSVHEDYGGCTLKRIGQIFGDVYCDSNRIWRNLSQDWKGVVDKDFYLNPDVEYGSLTDPRDNQTYKTVIIGDKEWMAQNLNYKPKDRIATYCYDNNENTCKNCGRYYTWEVAVDACPKGWHLPSSNDWKDILDTDSSRGDSTSKVKSSMGWYNGNNGSNSTGMTILPTGTGNINKNSVFWSGANSLSAFWTSTLDSADFVQVVHTGDNYQVINSHSASNVLYQVRCIHD